MDESGKATWIKWLADIGWGTDFMGAPLPPCSPAELAAEYHRVDPSRSLEDWTREITEKFEMDSWQDRLDEGELPPPRRGG